MPDDLYHRDIMAWSSGQADRLRRLRDGERVNDVDWDNLIEEVESVGQSELQAVRSLLTRALEHGLKCHAWPNHAANRKWRNEIATFLTRMRKRLQPGMAQHLDPTADYTDARDLVLLLDMRVPPQPLPERITLSVADLYDRGFGPDQLIARLTEAASNAT